MSNVKTADGYDVSVPSATHTSSKPPSLFGSMTKIMAAIAKFGSITIKCAVLWTRGRFYPSLCFTHIGVPNAHPTLVLFL